MPGSPQQTTGTDVNHYHKVAGWLSAIADPEDTQGICHLQDRGRDAAAQVIYQDEDEGGELVDVDELPELSKYRHALTQSFAYQWLLSSFQVQRRLTSPGGQPCIRTGIRQTIIHKLRPVKILSRHDSGEATMSFVVHWDPVRFHAEQEYGAPLTDVLERAVTITGYGNDVQVSTCLDYMSQTWPETGIALLRFLQATVAVLQDTGGSWSGKQSPFPSLYFSQLPA